MASRWLPRAVLSTAAAGALVLTTVSLALMANPLSAGAAGALATTEIPLLQSNVKATDFKPGDQDCSDAPFANIQDNQDGWHFVVGGDDTSFVELRLTFNTGSGTVVVTVPGPPVSGASGILTESGGKFMHAWVITPAGWTLVSGEADVTYTGNAPAHFQLSHTCPGTPTTTTATTKPPTTTTTTTGTETTTTGTTTTPDEGGDLPVTGAGLGGLIAAGLILTGGGVALILARRRRDAETEATDGTAIG